MPKHLAKRFPQWQEKIEHLLRSDPDFRALCLEYEETAKALAFCTQLSKLSLRQIERQKAECKELLQELQTEVRLTLELRNAKPLPRRQ